ncbi:ribose-5-phosphate isomerase RpiA [Methanohalophilus sp.]|uniref:ribose-5-phosphate isomerase RpiA n=1 Tax=Methanohalophilus sp. TaxID=1966352 RepID=UPI00260577D4|nr:ribose-5-phosphate isomerase RpiA [Methanohalophilus sp.]MDK2892198.1 ribose 5-phosphate isomerase [Methanohalophilus sp.]
MADRNSAGYHAGKEAAGKSAADLVEDGMIVGLGTGSTTAYTIKEIGKRVKEGLDILAVVTSYQSEMLAIEAGIPLTSLAEHSLLDIAIDGADQVNFDLDAIKGGGAAHTREKIVALSAKRFIIVADDSKYVKELEMPVPIEVLPCACKLVQKQIADLGGNAVIRAASKKDGPVITDNGNFILDADFGKIKNPEELSSDLSKCVGLVEHGIFTNVDEVYIGDLDGNIKVLKK